jgi:asparagine synthase (glutamine-hydrolysing)
MCGICGWLVNEQGDLQFAQLKAMLRVLSHRGPDDSGSYFGAGNRVGFGHNRLSILDLSERGHQPMENPGTGDVLVFNGEIYNFKELRRELEKLGCHFSSHSDTEVLLNSYAVWSISCLDKLEGMYAFALWSQKTKTLHLVRDPMGIKPLYYLTLPNNGGLVFASEIKAFFELPGFNAKIDRKSLDEFLEFGYTFSQSSTILKHVRKLPPGHRLDLTLGGKPSISRYYYPEVNISLQKSREVLEEELFLTLRDVVREHLTSDVPIGLLLSGGLDSSIIAALASHQTRIRTFSFGFGQSVIDERSKARAVSRFIGSEHEEFVITPDEIREDLGNSVRHMDDLFADWGTFATRVMYEKCMERGAKVVLVGEGADELFGGYWGRFSPSLAGSKSWKMDWRLFKLHRVYIGRRYGRSFWAYRQRMRKYLGLTNGDLFSAIRLFESREQLSNNYAMKVDKASMAASVEARVPYLDTRIVRIAYQIPRDLLIGENHVVKSLLASMATRYKLLPSEIVQQKKFGIGLPPEWMDTSETFREFACGRVLDENGWVDELGFRPAMTEFFQKDVQGYGFPNAISIFRNLAWKLLLLNLWSRHYGIRPENG